MILIIDYQSKKKMISNFHPTINERKEEKWVKMKIILGLVVTAEVVDMEGKTRGALIRRMRKELVRFYQDVLGENKFQIIFNWKTK